jgi:hypothetical protein
MFPRAHGKKTVNNMWMTANHSDVVRIAMASRRISLTLDACGLTLCETS